MRRYLIDFWETITKQPIDISECETFRQARRWFTRHGVPAAKAAKTQDQLRDVLLDEIAARPFSSGDKLSNDIRRYLNGIDEDEDSGRLAYEYERRMLEAETPYDFERARKAYFKYKKGYR